MPGTAGASIALKAVRNKRAMPPTSLAKRLMAGSSCSFYFMITMRRLIRVLELSSFFNRTWVSNPETALDSDPFGRLDLQHVWEAVDDKVVGIDLKVLHFEKVVVFFLGDAPPDKIQRIELNFYGSSGPHPCLVS